MIKNSIFLCTLVLLMAVSAKTEENALSQPLAPPSLDKANEEAFLDTVEIGNDDFFTPFILEGTSDFGAEDAAVKEQIDSRDFASDEFYMRNIDREEFEQERLLMLFVDEDQNQKFKTWVQLREEEE